MACRHERWEPVTLLVTGEHVANVCANPECMAELPLGYDGEVTAIHVWGQAEPIAYFAEASPEACWEHDTVPEQEGDDTWLLCRRCGWQSERITRPV